MSETVRPIHLPSATALEALRQRVLAALEPWAREWMNGWVERDLRIQTLQVGCVSDGYRSTAVEFDFVRSKSSSRVWLRSSTVDRSRFGCAVLGTHVMPGLVCADDWSTAIVDAAWTARNEALGAALLGEPVEAVAPTEVPAALYSLGSGAALVSCEALGLHAIADRPFLPAAASSPRTASAPRCRLAPLSQAMRRSNARLDVMLGSVTLEFPKLVELRPGDVLCLPQRLDQPLDLACEGTPFARVALGERAGRKCVQLLSPFHDVSPVEPS